MGLMNTTGQNERVFW